MLAGVVASLIGSTSAQAASPQRTAAGPARSDQRVEGLLTLLGSGHNQHLHLKTDGGRLELLGPLATGDLANLSAVRVALWFGAPGGASAQPGAAHAAGAPAQPAATAAGGSPPTVTPTSYQVLDVGGGVQPQVGFVVTDADALVFVALPADAPIAATTGLPPGAPTAADPLLLPGPLTSRLARHPGALVWLTGAADSDGLRPTRFGLIRPAPAP